MIPKIIHYVWVGDNDKPKLVQNCINSWKKYCPDYEFIEWNNESLKQIDNLYVTQAFECKKWAFVSDYLRLYALKKHGGFYFDTDLEITNNIDKFTKYSYVTGFEEFNKKFAPITALIGAEKDNKIISDLLAEYENIEFIKNGKIDCTTNVTRISKYLSKTYKIELNANPNKELSIDENSKIFPVYYFCKKYDNKENYSIHHYNGSWIDGYSRKNIISFPNLKIVRLRRRKNITNSNYPLLKNEKIIKKLKILNYEICIVCENGN